MRLWGWGAGHLCVIDCVIACVCTSEDNARFSEPRQLHRMVPVGKRVFELTVQSGKSQWPPHCT
jgi:hypothetical protein